MKMQNSAYAQLWIAKDASRQKQRFGMTKEGVLRASVVIAGKKSLAEARLEDSGGGYWFTGILMIFFWIA